MSKLIQTRRQFLITSAVAVPSAGIIGASAIAQSATLTATPRQTEGPFYPRTKPNDIDNDLSVFGDQAPATEDLLAVSGKVLDQQGKSISGARVEFWHCDKHGTYHHVGSSGPKDKSFQGYGEMVTNGEGHYSFRTVKPGLYTGRTRHIHFKVIAPGRRPLTSQMYFDTDMEENMRDGIYRRLGSAGQKAVTMKTQDLGGDGLPARGQIDIVLA